MIMKLCKTCNKPWKMVREHEEVSYEMENGDRVVDYGLRGICACDSRYKDATVWWSEWKEK